MQARRTGRDQLFQRVLDRFDVVGGRYEEQDFAATGSGGREARSALRAGWRDDLDADGALALAMQGLVVAAEQDVATAGPDLRRGILPVVVVVDADGFREVDDTAIEALANRALEVTP